MTYILHYAPDNASLIIRLALEHRGLPFQTRLVNRKSAEQSSAAYRALNPNGLIPVLETPQGPIFETGAILLWLADTHGGLGPSPDAPDRGDFLKWLFYVANTAHPLLRMLFYPEKYIGAGSCDALRAGLKIQLTQCFETLNDMIQTQQGWCGVQNPGIVDFYICALLRWPALYPTSTDVGWFDLSQYPALQQLCHHIETLACTAALQAAEGLGQTPFSAPHLPSPPEGSAT